MFVGYDSCFYHTDTEVFVIPPCYIAQTCSAFIRFSRSILPGATSFAPEQEESNNRVRVADDWGVVRYRTVRDDKEMRKDDISGKA